MAKKTGAGFFLEKGEKVIFGVGVALSGLLLLFGVMTLTGAADPAAMIKTLNTQADRVNQEVANKKTGEVTPLPEWVVKPAGIKLVSSSQFPLVGQPFEPVEQPSMLRENPKVLQPVAAQLNLIRGPLRSLDIQVGADNEPLVGVLVTAPVKETDRQKMAQAVGGILKNFRTSTTRPRRPANANVPPRPGVPPPGGLPPGMSVPPGMGMEGMPEGMGLPGGGQRDDRTVRYHTPEEVARGQYPLAETVYPIQAVLVHAAFPVKEQVEEIKRALRLKSAQEALAEAQSVGGTGVPAPQPAAFALGAQPAPVADEDGRMVPGGQPPGFGSTLGQSVGLQFAGFEVQRRVITPSGQDLGWSPFNHEDEYFTKIRARKIADRYDGDLLPFLRYDQRMAAPLPEFAEGLETYPAMRIPVIVEAIKKMKEMGVVPPTPSEFELRFKNTAGDSNPYAPFGSAVVGSGLANPAGTPTGAMGGFPPGGVPPAGFRQPGMNPGLPGGQPGAANLADTDYTLVRFLDPTVEAGYTYEYKIRVKMRNPNFGKTAEVQQKNDATMEFVTGDWWTVPERITVPPASYMYAYDSGEYLKKTADLVKEAGTVNQFRMRSLLETREVEDGRRAVVQVQQWLPQVRASGDRSEPVGTWVSAEIPVARGEFIGKRQLIKLPLWSSAAHAYILRELAGGVKVANLRGGDSNQPKGWPITFRTKTLVVDFEGGPVRTQYNNRELRDDSATELLLLHPNGTLEVKSSAVDMADPKRAKDDKTWIDWVERVKARKDAAANAGTNPDGTPGSNFTPRQ